MNPQEPEQQNNQPSVDPQPPVTPITPQLQQPVVTEAPRKSHKKLALWLIIGPTALFILAIVLSILSGLIFNGSSSDGGLFGDTSPLRTIINLFFFLSMLISIITWLPGLIIGIVLLAKQSK
jgi:hypothetical protein